MQVEVVNTSCHCIEQAALSTAVFLINHDGSHFVKAVSHSVANVAADSVTALAQCLNQAAAGAVTLVFLWLRGNSGEIISRNVYWLPDTQVLHSLFCLWKRCSPLAAISLWELFSAERSVTRAFSEASTNNNSTNNAIVQKCMQC